MFEWFPILRGKYFTYTEYLFILTIVGFPVFSATSFSISKILNFLNRKKDRSLRLQSPESSGDEYYDSRTQDETISPTFRSISSEKQMLNPKPQPAGTPTVNFFNELGWFFASHWPGCFAVWSFLIPVWFAFILDYSIFLLRIRYRKKMDKLRLYTALQSKDKTEAYGRKVKPINSFYTKLTIFFTIFDILLHLLFTGFCVSSYQDYVGPIFGTASLSSTFTRYFQLPEFCPPGPPCHVYATLPEDTATSVFINVHTNEKYNVIGIEYELDHSSYESERDVKSQNSTSFKVAGTDRNGRRKLHHFYLDNLVPDSTYNLRIVYDGIVQHRTVYKTLPGQDSPRDVILVQGGDMGNTKATRDVTKATIAMNPDVLVLGGDLAYDNGMCECYFTWDYFLKDLEQVNEALGRLVPVIYSLGNHDAGIDEMNRRGGLEITEKGPFYMTYFPQHSRLSSRTKAILPEVPTFEERKSYHYHKIGKMLLFTLDSGYYSDLKEQALWMESILKDHLSWIKIALYHCPIYYACRDIAVKNHEVIDAQRKEWMPVFDDNKFMLAFENHEHYMKRTLSLRNDKYDSLGTVYIGNGQWGTYDHKNCKLYNETGVYESIQEVNHYWAVNISFNAGVVTNTPYDQDNKALLPPGIQRIDQYTMEDIKY